jgi:hypothetical protein
MGSIPGRIKPKAMKLVFARHVYKQTKCACVIEAKESEVVINQLTSERNDQTVWDPIVI